MNLGSCGVRRLIHFSAGCPQIHEVPVPSRVAAAMGIRGKLAAQRKPSPSCAHESLAETSASFPAEIFLYGTAKGGRFSGRSRLGGPGERISNRTLIGLRR